MASPFPIHNEENYLRAVELVDRLWGAAPGTQDYETLDVMSTLIDVYEKSQYALPAVDPRTIINLKIQLLGWSQRTLARHLGWGPGRVSEVLSGRRSMTIRMVQELSSTLGIPASLLIPSSCADEPQHVWTRLSASIADRVTSSVRTDTSFDVKVAQLLETALDSALPRASVYGIKMVAVEPRTANQPHFYVEQEAA